MPRTRKVVSLRSVSIDLWYQARVQALVEKKTLSQWVEEAIKEKLEKKGKL